MYNVFVGCFMYADDFLLLAASVSVLQAMMNVCADEIAYLDMRFNVSKSSVIRIGRLFRRECSQLHVDSQTLEFVHFIKYLGMSSLDVIL